VQKYDKKFLPLVVFSSVLVLLLIFTATSRFNLVGYSYQFNETTMTLQFEVGYLTKTIIDLPFEKEMIFVTSAIDQANNLWMIHVFLFSIYIAAFVGLFLPPWKPQKYFKSITCMYVLSLVTLTIWSLNAHTDLYKDIVKNMSRLVN
jgi:hypothetical protein